MPWFILLFVLLPRAASAELIDVQPGEYHGRVFMYQWLRKHSITWADPCTIRADVKIINLQVDNIDRLRGVVRIEGNLTISANEYLVNVDGLADLEEVEGYVVIQRNPLLENLNGLRALKNAQYVEVGNKPRPDLEWPESKYPPSNYGNPHLRDISGLAPFIRSILASSAERDGRRVLFYQNPHIPDTTFQAPPRHLEGAPLFIAPARTPSRADVGP